MELYDLSIEGEPKFSGDDATAKVVLSNGFNYRKDSFTDMSVQSLSVQSVQTTHRNTDMTNTP